MREIKITQNIKDEKVNLQKNSRAKVLNGQIHIFRLIALNCVREHLITVDTKQSTKKLNGSFWHRNKVPKFALE